MTLFAVDSLCVQRLRGCDAISRVRKYGAKSSLCPAPIRAIAEAAQLDGVFVDMEAPGALELIMDIAKEVNSKSSFSPASELERITVTERRRNFLLLKL